MSSLRSRILHLTLQRVTSAINLRLSIQEQRTRMDELARRGIRIPKGVTVRTTQAGGIHAEWIDPANASTQKTILYLHGGGYCICSLDTHRGLAARLALATQARVLIIDYRLAPENGRAQLVFADPRHHSIQAKIVAPREEPDGRSTVVDESEPNAVLYCLSVNTTDFADPSWMPPGTAWSMPPIWAAALPTSVTA